MLFALIKRVIVLRLPPIRVDPIFTDAEGVCDVLVPERTHNLTREAAVEARTSRIIPVVQSLGIFWIPQSVFADTSLITRPLTLKDAGATVLAKT